MVGGTVALAAAGDDGLTWPQRLAEALGTTAGPLILVVIVAALMSGGGRSAVATLLVAQTAATAPLVGRWFDAAPDVLLLAALLWVAATATVAAWRPVSAALAEIASPPRAVPMHP